MFAANEMLFPPQSRKAKDPVAPPIPKKRDGDTLIKSGTPYANSQPAVEKM